jgi:hypothetical protein
MRAEWRADRCRISYGIAIDPDGDVQPVVVPAEHCGAQVRTNDERVAGAERDQVGS